MEGGSVVSLIGILIKFFVSKNINRIRMCGKFQYFCERYCLSSVQVLMCSG